MASYDKRESGKWSVRFRVIDDTGFEKNKRLSGFNTKREAEQAYVNYINNYTEKTIKNKDELKSIKLRTIYEKYLKFYKPSVKYSTYYDFMHSCEKHILPEFGNVPIGKITKQRLIDWQEKITAQGYSYKMKMKLRSNFYALFKYACTYLDFTINPFINIPSFKRKKEKKEIIVWNLDEFNKFIDVVDDPMYNLFFSFLYWTGCRKGEVYALQWRDVDFDNKLVKIYKNLSEKSNTDKPYMITSPKNESSNREIFIPDILVKNLINYKTMISPTNDDYVFGGNRPLADNTVQRKLKYYCNLAQVNPINMHAFRHSHASLLISSGENILVISKRLGHSNTEQTLNTYAHLLKDDAYKAVLRLNKLTEN